MKLFIVSILVSMAHASSVLANPSMADRLKEVATKSFLRSQARFKQQDSHNESVQSVAEDSLTDAQEEQLEETTDVPTNATDKMENEAHDAEEPDDGTVLYGDDPMEATSMINTNVTEEAADDNEDLEDEEDPEEIEDEIPANSTDEFAYENAHDDGEVLYGTNPLEADDADEADEPEFVEPNEGQMQLAASNSTDQGSDESSTADADESTNHDEEHDDGELLYGTNPLEDEPESVEDPVDEKDPYAHLQAIAGADNDATETDYAYETEHDDGTVLYGTNPLENTEDDESDNDESANDADFDADDGSAESEEIDDGQILTGTNPLEEKNSDEDDEVENAAYSNVAEEDTDESEELQNEAGGEDDSSVTQGSNPIQQDESDGHSTNEV